MLGLASAAGSSFQLTILHMDISSKRNQFLGVADEFGAVQLQVMTKPNSDVKLMVIWSEVVACMVRIELHNVGEPSLSKSIQ